MAARAYDSQLFRQVEELGYVVRPDGNLSDFSVNAGFQGSAFKAKNRMTGKRHEFIAGQAEKMLTRPSSPSPTGPIASFRASIQFVS